MTLSGQHFYLVLTVLDDRSTFTVIILLIWCTTICHLPTMPHNPLLSDHYPITFNFPLPCNINSDSKFSFRRTISSGAAKAFTDLLPGSYCRVNEDSIIIPANPHLKLINLRTAFSSHCAKRWMLLRPLKERKSDSVINTTITIKSAQCRPETDGSPSEAWFCSRFLPASEGVFPCHCRPRLALRGSSARALCKAALRQSCIVKSAIQIKLNGI